MAITKGKIITITSVKGGTGKTTTLLNLAGIYSNMGKRVIIIDLDLYTGSLAATLNLEINSDIYKLVNDLANNHFTYIENYVLKYNDYIDLLAAPKDPRYAGKINSKYIKIILARAALKYDIVLADTNHALDEKNLVTLDNSDEIVYIINNDLIDLKNMKTLVSIYKDLDKNNYKIILNESLDRNRSYLSKHDIKNIIKNNIDYTIPASFYIKNIDKYILDGQILTLNKQVRKSNKKAIQNLEEIAKSLLKDSRNKVK